jgi:hypothetical protein
VLTVSTTFTPNALLQKPATADRNWDLAINKNTDLLDGTSAIGQLCVTPTEVPSASLNVRVSGGSYHRADGTVGNFAGAGPLSMAASATSCLWLTDSGQVMVTPAFPASAHLRLAQVVTTSSVVQSVTDERVSNRVGGTGLGFVLKSGDTVTGPFSVTSAASGNAALAVDPTVPGVGFFGTAPQSPAPALVAVTDSTNGVASNTLTDVGTAFTQAQLNANFATLAQRVNGLIAALKRHGLMSS